MTKSTSLEDNAHTLHVTENVLYIGAKVCHICFLLIISIQGLDSGVMILLDSILLSLFHHLQLHQLKSS